MHGLRTDDLGDVIQIAAKCDCGCFGVVADCIHFFNDSLSSSVGDYDADFSDYSEDSLSSASDMSEDGARDPDVWVPTVPGPPPLIINLISDDDEVVDLLSDEEIDLLSDEELVEVVFSESVLHVAAAPFLPCSSAPTPHQPSAADVAELVRREGIITQTGMVKKCLSVLRDSKQLTPRQLIRRMEKFLTASPSPSFDTGLDKPYSMHVKDMFRADMFQSGSHPLPPSSLRLRPTAFARQHVAACVDCNPLGFVSPHCYFATMLRCLTHGWLPTMDKGITPAYASKGNSPKVALYNDSVSTAFKEMLANKVVVKAPPDQPAVTSPLGVVVKNSDLYRAKELARVLITDQESLNRANKALLALFMKQVKIRVTMDTTQSGVNGAMLVPPFRMSSPAEASMLVVKNGYLAKLDISSYYHMFLFALEARALFLFRLHGESWFFAAVFFGLSSAPYFISTWSAECQMYLNKKKTRCAHYMDDWFVADADAPKTERQLQTVATTLTDVGFVLQESKTERGQQLVYLGVLYDTITMSIRFDALQCAAMRLELASSLQRLEQHLSLSSATVAHICGKLAWYSECIQRGRLYTRSWWNLLRLRGNPPSNKLRDSLIQQTNWWMTLLASWSRNECTGNEFPILSYSELIAHPEKGQLIQSDASGVDGFGFFHSDLSDATPLFVARNFPPSFVFTSSHGAELTALASFMENDARCNCLSIWISDCLSAVWSVNKGRCMEEGDLALLDRILSAADLKHNSLIALWVPRETNQLADYLSHLCHYTNRDEVSGSLSELATAAGGARR